MKEKEIQDYEDKLKSWILNTKLNWWNGLMVFSGVAMTFLSIRPQDILSKCLILLYFVIAMFCIYAIFTVKKFYDYLAKIYPERTTKDITEEHVVKDSAEASEKNREIERVENWLERITAVTIALTLFYLFRLF